MVPFLMLLIGLICLVKGADFLVDGASSIARRLQVPDIVIGLTVVAFGTSLPELFVNIYASLTGNAGIAVGNVLGSNIANIFLILGVSGMITPLRVQRGTVWAEIPLSLLAAVMLAVAVNDHFFDHVPYNLLTRTDGLSFLGFFLVFFYYSYSISKDQQEMGDHAPEQSSSWKKSLFFVVLGMVGLALGGDWIVEGATAIARRFGMTDDVIGLTVVAIGTSLPELATSAVAAMRKNAAIAVGNVVGSNIFNIFFVLGISASIKPLPFSPVNNMDIGVVIASNLLLFGFMFTGRRRAVDRWESGIMLTLYVTYMITLLMRNDLIPSLF